MTILATATHSTEPCQSAEVLVGRRAMPRLSVDGPGQLRVADAVSGVLVSDISRTGARLKMAVPLPQGTACTLLWKGLTCRCRVVWSDPFAVGVVFEDAALDNEFLNAHARKTPVDSRKSFEATLAPGCATRNSSSPAPRLRTAPRAELWQGDNWAIVRLKEISQDSFVVTWFAGCQPRQAVLLRGDGLPTLQGVISSVSQLTVECRLLAPLHLAVLEHVKAMLAGT